MVLCCSVARAEDAPANSKAKPKSVIPQEKDRGRHEQFLKDKAAQAKKGPIQVVFIGDSITDGWRGPRPHDVAEGVRRQV